MLIKILFLPRKICFTNHLSCIIKVLYNFELLQSKVFAINK